VTNQEKAEALYERMAEVKVATEGGTLLSAAVLCDYAGQRGFINWLVRQLDELDAPRR
jgi:hypothetical protein